MTINKIITDNKIILELVGRLDTVTSIQLSDEINKIITESPVDLLLDFKDLDYISSAGLRVLLLAQKQTTALKMKLEIIGSNVNVREVFKVTGFSNILTIK